MPLHGYPKLSSRCAHGDHLLRQNAPDAPWVDAFGAQECPDAPNPDEGPMPGHTPGAPVLSPPSWPETVSPRSDLEPPSPPRIPRIAG